MVYRAFNRSSSSDVIAFVIHMCVLHIPLTFVPHLLDSKPGCVLALCGVPLSAVLRSVQQCNVLFLLRFHLIVKHTVAISFVIHVRSPHVHCPHVSSPFSARSCVSSCGIFSFQRPGLSAVLCSATHCSTCWDICALSTRHVRSPHSTRS